MLKDKNDRKVEEMMNTKGYSHAEAMAELKKKDPNKEAKGSDSGDDAEVSSDGEEVCLPSNLLPDVKVGKEISFNLSGEVTDVTDEMVYIKTKDLHVDVREPFKEKDSTLKAVAVDR